MTPTSPALPSTRTEDVVETLHGETIVDPYRWLEDADSPETRVWVEEQNAYTCALLDAVPQRPAIEERLKTLLTIGTIQPPVERGGRYFHIRRDGDENQPRLYVRDGLTGVDRVLLDPNAASADATVALDWWYPSWNGRYVAYGYSAHGDERSTLYVIDVDSGELLPDSIPHTRYTSLGWLPDDSGFYYTRTPQAFWDSLHGEEYYHRAVYLHRLGTSVEDEPEVHPDDGDPKTIPSIVISEDGRWLLLTINRGWERSDVYLRDLATPNAEFTPVAVGFDALFDGFFAGDQLYLHTNLDAPRYRLFAVPPTRPQRETWREVVPERADAVLEHVRMVDGRMLAVYLSSATSHAIAIGLDGGESQAVPLPEMGTITALSGRATSGEAFLGFESFTTPPRVYRYDAKTGAVEIWAAVETSIDLDAYETRQVWYESKDGTRVSMFLVQRRGPTRSGEAPTLLTGYGGFNISRTPLFGRSLMLWLDAGGLYALPNLRGGGEYGEEWHRAGMLARKQNVFDDFIAAAEHLIAEGYTSPEHLAILGGSNGGLLVGAALTQRPDLFRAVICAVPLLDMIRYHHFLIAKLWTPEYGSSDDPEQFRHLFAYSPYHHVRAGTDYPAVLFTTAASDSRVDPLHARKMAALLQAASDSDRPILLRTEFEAGHGIGKPLYKVLESETDNWSFLFWQLGVDV